MILDPYVSIFFIGLLYLNWILTLFVKKCSRTMTLFRFLYMGNFAKFMCLSIWGFFSDFLKRKILLTSK